MHSGIAGIEADALIVVEAQQQITNLGKESNIFMQKKDMHTAVAHEAAPVVNLLPHWAQPLENVLQLKANNGAKVRKCILEAIRRGPPDWARQDLAYSIRKHVYTGNAAGPTKNIVERLLADARTRIPPQATSEHSIDATSLCHCHIALPVISASTVLLLVQATILLEDMIKSEYIKNHGATGHLLLLLPRLLR